MKTLPSTLLLIAVLASGCALFKKPEPLYKDVPQATEPSVSLPQQAMMEPAVAPPTPAVVPAPASAKPTPPPAPVVVPKPVEPVAPAAHATSPAPEPAKPVPTPAPAATAVPAPVVEAPVEDAGSAKTVITADLSMRGKVVAYNAVGKFVVLSFQVGRMPVIGQQLSIYRGNLKVGEVRITGPQKEENTIADLVVGDASSGDEVRVK